MRLQKLKLKLDRSQVGSLIYRVSIWRPYDHPRNSRIRWHKQEIGCVEKVAHGKWEARTDWGRVIGQYKAQRHAIVSLLEQFAWHEELGRYVSNDEDSFNEQISEYRKGIGLDQVKPGVHRLLEDSSFSFTDYTYPRLGVEDDEAMSLADLIAGNLDD